MKRIPLMILCLLLFAGAAAAQTPDGETPAEETVCDDLTGAAFGLCTAYCEAMDCDSPLAQASDKACERVFDNMVKITGLAPPCEQQCPCVDEFPLWDDVVNGNSVIDSCVDDMMGNVTATVVGSQLFVTATTCGVQSEGGLQSIDITPEESALCAQLLVDEAAADGVSCDDGGGGG